MKLKLITIALTCIITLTAFAENIETPKANAGTAAIGAGKPTPPPPPPTRKDTKPLTVTPKGPGPVGSSGTKAIFVQPKPGPAPIGKTPKTVKGSVPVEAAGTKSIGGVKGPGAPPVPGPGSSAP
jgi:hypothetical protein